MSEKNYTREELLTIILENCPGYILATDAHGKIIYLNQNCADLHGMTKEQLKSMTIYDMVERKLVSDGASIHVIKEKRTVKKSLTTSEGKTILVTGKPYFNKSGHLEMVITNSHEDIFLQDLFDALKDENTSLQRAYDAICNYSSNKTEIVVESPLMKQTLETALLVADSQSSVMITGESGTGKEVFAHIIHENSSRANNVFIPVNCATIPPELIESELFGYEKGSFTGASKDGKIGVFEAADGGSIFLDEIGELPMSLQPKLLRVLDSGEIRRIGSSKTKTVNIRVIAATNRDLAAMVQESRFREDLYYRMNVIPLSLAPLRERTEEIPLLANQFISMLNRRYGKHKAISSQAIKILCQYNWPGNIRELKNIIERLFITVSKDIIDEYDIKLVLNFKLPYSNTNAVSEQTPMLPQQYSDTFKDALTQFQKSYIEDILKSCNGNVKLAAKKMAVHPSGLYKKIDKLKIDL